MKSPPDTSTDEGEGSCGQIVFLPFFTEDSASFIEENGIDIEIKYVAVCCFDICLSWYGFFRNADGKPFCWILTLSPGWRRPFSCAFPVTTPPSTSIPYVYQHTTTTFRSTITNRTTFRLPTMPPSERRVTHIHLPPDLTSIPQIIYSRSKWRHRSSRS